MESHIIQKFKTKNKVLIKITTTSLTKSVGNYPLLLILQQYHFCFFTILKLSQLS